MAASCHAEFPYPISWLPSEGGYASTPAGPDFYTVSFHIPPDVPAFLGEPGVGQVFVFQIVDLLLGSNLHGSALDCSEDLQIAGHTQVTIVSYRSESVRKHFVSF